MSAVVARMVCHEVAATMHGSRVKLGAVYPNDTTDPHAEEIKAFFEATPQGTFEALIKNDKAAEHFQPGDHYYVTLERIPKPEPTA